MVPQKNDRKLVLFFLLSALLLGGCRCAKETLKKDPASKPVTEAPKPVSETGVLEVAVTGLRNQKGRLLVAVFKSKSGFPSDSKQAYRKTGEVPDGKSAMFRFENVPYGIYGVSALHDENENGVLDKNFIGIPTEGAGVSNNPKQGFGPPAFEEAAFEIDSPSLRIDVAIQYP